METHFGTSIQRVDLVLVTSLLIFHVYTQIFQRMYGCENVPQRHGKVTEMY